LNNAALNTSALNTIEGMRVIAGEFRSRKLIAVEGQGTRPTPDRLRETLFSILSTQIGGCVFVDAFAGTGAVGIEALSRGARQAVFLEKDRRALQAIRENLRTLKAEMRARVIPGSASQHLSGIEADIVFLDPPYTDEQLYVASLNSLEANPPGLTIVQHSVRFAPAEQYGPLLRGRVVKQGDNALSFYKTLQ
jgi:16S rRNA (guanine(966)-N(2))-methyltransferase RsmD